MTLALSKLSIRQQFPILQRTAHGHPFMYLDTAATSQKPQKVIDALTHFYLHEYGTVHRAVYELSMQATELYDAARVKVKEFLHARHEEEIVFTRGTTDSINLVCRSFSSRFLQKGDEILLSEIEHHSNLVPWQMLAEEKGVCLRFIPVNDKGEMNLEEYARMLSKKTKLVSIAHIFNTAGTINPVQEMTEMAHQWGAKVLIDGAQAAGHIPVDVQQIGADFYAFSGHKMYGPTGVGVLYGKLELLEEMPPVQGGGDMIEKVSLQGNIYQKPPLRFEAGTPMFAEVIGLKEAISFLEEIGIEEIQQLEGSLLEYATERFHAMKDVTLYGTSEKKAGIICFNVSGVHPMDLGIFLDLQGIAIRTGHHCSHPAMKRFGIDTCARISFGVYNTKEELERFFEVLQDVSLRLRS